MKKKALCIAIFVLGILVIPVSADTPKMKILFIAASPQGLYEGRDLTRIDYPEENRAIINKIEYLNKFDIINVPAARSYDLGEKLEKHPQIVHFSGHGTPDGILLQTDTGGAQLLETADLKNMLIVYNDNCDPWDRIRLVVFNACNTFEVAKGIQDVVDCAIGMKDAIKAEASICFAASFYQKIGNGGSVKEAYKKALSDLRLQGISGDRTPQLCHLPKNDPENVYIHLSNLTDQATIRAYKHMTSEQKKIIAEGCRFIPITLPEQKSQDFGPPENYLFCKVLLRKDGDSEEVIIGVLKTMELGYAAQYLAARFVKDAKENQWTFERIGKGELKSPPLKTYYTFDYYNFTPYDTIALYGVINNSNLRYSDIFIKPPELHAQEIKDIASKNAIAAIQKKDLPSGVGGGGPFGLFRRGVFAAPK